MEKQGKDTYVKVLNFGEDVFRGNDQWKAWYKKVGPGRYRVTVEGQVTLGTAGYKVNLINGFRTTNDGVVYDLETIAPINASAQVLTTYTVRFSRVVTWRNLRNVYVRYPRVGVIRINVIN